MTLDQHIEKLVQLQKEGHGNLLVVYSIDEEGNEYKEVHFEPKKGYFVNENFVTPISPRSANAACIN